MVNRIEKQKMKLKEKMTELADEYCEKWEKGLNQEDFDINQIERLMIENQDKVKAALNEISSELTSISIDRSEKKMP